MKNDNLKQLLKSMKDKPFKPKKIQQHYSNGTEPVKIKYINGFKSDNLLIEIKKDQHEDFYNIIFRGLPKKKRIIKLLERLPITPFLYQRVLKKNCSFSMLLNNSIQQPIDVLEDFGENVLTIIKNYISLC